MSFDWLAPHYQWLEALTFGSTLQKARTRWIESVPPPRRVLIVGEGDGRFLCEFMRNHPDASVDCVDASAQMLDLARKRLSKALPQGDVRFLHENILSWSPSGSYDFLVTNFVLDCFDEPELDGIIRKLAQAASSGAHLLHADFAIPEGFLSRIRAKLWLAVMYCFFRSTTGISAKELIDPTPELEANGFRRLAHTRWRLGFVKSELWRFEPVGGSEADSPVDVGAAESTESGAISL